MSEQPAILWECLVCDAWWMAPEASSEWCPSCHNSAEPHNDCERRRQLREERQAREDELHASIAAQHEARDRNRLDALIRRYGVPEWATQPQPKGEEQ
jgi:hypothetical protein